MTTQLHKDVIIFDALSELLDMFGVDIMEVTGSTRNELERFHEIASQVIKKDAKVEEDIIPPIVELWIDYKNKILGISEVRKVDDWD